MNFQFSYIWEYLPRVLSALPTTLLIVLIASVFGVIIGIVIAFFRLERIPVLNQLAVLYVSFIRGTPILIQMFVIYYGLPLLLKLIGINIMRADKIYFIYITYSINAGAFFSEIFRSSISSIPKTQWDAAKSIGLTKAKAYTRIIIPQSIVVAIPSVGTNIVFLLQDTSLAFALGILDVIGAVQAAGVTKGHTLEGYLVAAILFAVLSIIIARVFGYIEKKTKTQAAVA